MEDVICAAYRMQTKQQCGGGAAAVAAVAADPAYLAVEGHCVLAHKGNIGLKILGFSVDTHLHPLPDRP